MEQNQIHGAQLEWVSTEILKLLERERQLKLANDKLESAQERLVDLLGASPAVIYSIEINGDTWLPTWVSENILEITGYSAKETLAPGWWEKQLHPDDRDRVLKELPQLTTLGSRNFEYRIRRKDGSYIWIHDAQRLLRGMNEGVKEVVGSWTDVSDRKKVEEELRQVHKFEALGKLTGGIAHDFNNLLMVITGHCQLLLAQTDIADDLRAELATVNEAGHRASQLTKQLLAFSRQQILQPSTLNLNAVVKEIQPMLRRVIGEDIELSASLARGLGLIKADQGQIVQVVMNLVINARDAMPQGGRILIETSNAFFDETHSHGLHAIAPGAYVMLAVSDTGCGMDSETQAHIFEPFFTTKEAGKGTGLGLSTVYGITKQSGGSIYIYSEPGLGSTFKIYLPQVVGHAAGVKESLVTIPFPLGSETILLVEDESGVRTLARAILQRCGYRVLDARNGQEALSICEEPTGPIQLLVTDVVMPGISGRHLAQQLRVLYPDLRVLYMSGYTEDAIVRHGILREETWFLQKPFSLDALAQKVRAVLDQQLRPNS